ncbi:glycosyltransferase family 2 protein [Seleniivibrio woodruffii]|uniref:Glycosyltransferase involved in cell wall biosynthesis n=1 Tax=Seleniivibrio woodruffii TaxID=1078050 RepID=A0A4R1K6W0_9BACT|nr:glycosyltransferase family 2 protein [Seleniivibrio woodruffii]TCK59513.1 glycosyltransferase involved in cell wall biosynthesis [Seleniivibrio woodruffii]TVZ35446.1 glycosyltransferase involved in cell wall biosynthesis [Seleniivibrio woodruffii]
MEKKLPISVAIISFNEEQNIERTLKAVLPFVSEVIIVDSHSTDGTPEIARMLGAKVYDEDWKGHIAQKNSALAKCTMPWILCLDCDEVVDEGLRADIERAVNSGELDGYSVNRRTFYMGKFLKHSWQPDWKLRLVKRDSKPEWGGYDPHDVLKINGKTGKLRGGHLLHYSYKDIYDHYQRLVKYAKIAAQSYHKNGEDFCYCDLVIKPAFAFIKKYILKAGFLDGYAGFAVACSSFIYVYLKYLFLKELLDEDEKNGKDNIRR